MGARWGSGSSVPRAAKLPLPAFPQRGRRAMLASRVARGSWGALRGATWARPGKGRALGALLPPAPICLGCLAERWRLRPAALGLWRPGAGPRGHCSGAGKATPGPPAGEGAAAEAPGGPWGPESAANLVRTEEKGPPWVGVAGPAGICGAQTWMRITCFDLSGSGASVSELLSRFPRSRRSYGQVIRVG